VIDPKKKYRTRDGQEVTNLRSNFGGEYPWVGAINGSLQTWTNAGKYFPDPGDAPLDLIEVPQIDVTKFYNTKNGKPVRLCPQPSGHVDYPVLGYIADAKLPNCWTVYGEHPHGEEFMTLVERPAPKRVIENVTLPPGASLQHGNGDDACFIRNQGASDLVITGVEFNDRPVEVSNSGNVFFDAFELDMWTDWCLVEDSVWNRLRPGNIPVSPPPLFVRNYGWEVVKEPEPRKVREIQIYPDKAWNNKACCFLNKKEWWVKTVYFNGKPDKKLVADEATAKAIQQAFNQGKDSK
jgi:hypothetical protein